MPLCVSPCLERPVCSDRNWCRRCRPNHSHRTLFPRRRPPGRPARSAVIRDSRPDWIILSAAYTDVDGCESNRDLAFAVNCEGAVNVAQGSSRIWIAPDVSSAPITFSTAPKDRRTKRATAKSHQRLWREQGARGRTIAGNPARGLHRPNLMAIWAWGQMLSRDNPEAGGHAS